MKNKPDLFVTLTIIYLALLTVCIAIYAILQLYAKEIDRGTATNLMIWSATLFPSIALLYTFNSWRIQKGSDVLSKLSEKSFYKLIDIEELHTLFYDEYSYKINLERFNSRIFDIEKVYINEISKVDKSIDELLKTLVLIQEETHNFKINQYIQEVQSINYQIKILINKLSLNYVKNKVVSNEYLDNHIIEMKDLSFKFGLNLVLIRNELINYIFHRDPSKSA